MAKSSTLSYSSKEVAAAATIEKRIDVISKQLRKILIENPQLPNDDELDAIMDLIQSLKENDITPRITISVLETTNIGKILNQAIKTIKRHKRSSDKGSTSNKWEELYTESTNLLKAWKESIEKEKKAATTKGDKNKKMSSSSPLETGKSPSTVSEYRTLLLSQRKELHKDPPVLPPTNISIESKIYPLPKRNKQTNELTFVANDEDPNVTKLLKLFKPNLTPIEILNAGSLGGTYFRPITSAVTNRKYTSKEALEDTFPKDVLDELPKPHSTHLTSSTYRTSINKYGVKCGGSLDMWESSGWISSVDVYGWYQWYCKFYYGRRCSDDARQIQRWLNCAGPKGRFKSQLCNKIIRAETSFDDYSISPVIRQTL